MPALRARGAYVDVCPLVRRNDVNSFGAEEKVGGKNNTLLEPSYMYIKSRLVSSLFLFHFVSLYSTGND